MLDRLDAAHAHDIVDIAQPIDFALRDRGVVEHLRLHVTVDAKHHAVAFQLVEDLRPAGGSGGGLHDGDLSADGAVEELFARLHGSAIDQPAFARFHPGDAVGRNARLQQPDARVHCGLARAEDAVVLRQRPALPQVRQRAGHDDAHAVGDREGPLVGRGDGGFEIGRVDQFAADRHLRLLAREEVPEAALAVVFAVREILHPARGQQVVAHYGLEVGEDFGPARQFEKALVGTGLVNPVLPQRHAVDPVGRTRLVQRDEGIGIVPVPAGRRMTVDHDHRCLFVLFEQRVDEGERGRARADDQVIRFESHCAVSPIRRGRPVPRRLHPRCDSQHCATSLPCPH